MNTLKYSDAYNKIIDAYFKDEIKPMQYEFCFCGTLHGSENWLTLENIQNAPYTAKEYRRMEHALLNHVGYRSESADYEKDLFSGMCAALEVLKTIHEERGEIIDQPTTFTKRVLTHA